MRSGVIRALSAETIGANGAILRDFFTYCIITSDSIVVYKTKLYLLCYIASNEIKIGRWYETLLRYLLALEGSALI